jgi:thiamine biosynthesis protein ThiS
MRIQVNGEDHILNKTMTVAALVASLALDTRKVAIERNAEIVPKSSYGETALVEGDRIEIVQFIGGG